MFSALGAAVNNVSYVCDQNGENCELVQVPDTGPVMPTGPQPTGTQLICDYSSQSDPGTCYYAVPAGTIATVNAIPPGSGMTAAQAAAQVAAAKAAAAKNPNPVSFLGMNAQTAILVGVGLVVVLAMVKSK